MTCSCAMEANFLSCEKEVTKYSVSVLLLRTFGQDLQTPRSNLRQVSAWFTTQFWRSSDISNGPRPNTCRIYNKLGQSPDNSDGLRTNTSWIYKQLGQYSDNSDGLRTNTFWIYKQLGQYSDNWVGPCPNIYRIYKQLVRSSGKCMQDLERTWTVLGQHTFHLSTFSCGILKNTLCTSESYSARSKLANSASPDLAQDWYAVKIESILVEHSPFPILEYALITSDISCL